MLTASDGVGVARDRAALAVDVGAGQALRQADHQHARQHGAERLAPPVVVGHIEPVAVGRAHDLAAVEIARQADLAQLHDRRAAPAAPARA